MYVKDSTSMGRTNKTSTVDILAPTIHSFRFHVPWFLIETNKHMSLLNQQHPTVCDKNNIEQ